MPTHLNVVISIPEVAGGGAGYGCTFFPDGSSPGCMVVGRVYAKAPNERLVHGQSMQAPVPYVVPGGAPMIITSTASGAGGAIPLIDEVVNSGGAFTVSGTISMPETALGHQGPLTFWGGGWNLDIATSKLGLPDIKVNESHVYVDNLVPGSRDMLGRPRQDPPSRERMNPHVGADEIPIRLEGIVAGGRDEDTTFLPEPAQLDTSVTYFQPTRDLGNPRGIPRQFLDLLRQNLSVYGIGDPSRMTPSRPGRWPRG